MPKTKRRRPDDPHMAQKKAIDVLIPPEVDPAIEDQIPVVDDLEYEGNMAGPTNHGAQHSDLSPENQAASETSAATAKALALMQDELRALKAELGKKVELQSREGDKGESGLPWTYYKKPDGWVVCAPGGASTTGKFAGMRSVTAYTTYIRKGFKHLGDYGSGSITEPPGSTRHFGPGNEFLRLLNAGGAKEFDVKQVLTYKWHINPPIAGLTFPQYEEVKDQVLLFECPDCDYEFYALDDDTEQHRAAFRHLRRNQDDGRHGYPREEASMVLESQGFPALAKHAAKAQLNRLSKMIPQDSAPNLRDSAEDLD